MLNYSFPTVSEPLLLPEPEGQEIQVIAKLLVYLPAYGLEFARRATEQLELAYAQGVREGNLVRMRLAYKCLQLGWVKASTALSGLRSWEHRHLQSRPGLAHRSNPEVAQLFYRAYLKVVEDPSYYRLRSGLTLS